MKTLRQIRRETQEKLGTAPAANGIPESLRCSTPNCCNRWTIRNVGDKPWCSPCYSALQAAASNRQLFTRPPSLETPPGPAAAPDNEEPLPF